MLLPSLIEIMATTGEGSPCSALLTVLLPRTTVWVGLPLGRGLWRTRRYDIV